MIEGIKSGHVSGGNRDWRHNRRELGTVSALVDTGATMTAVPASVLKRLGVEPAARKALQFAQGEIRTMDVGYARVRVEDQEIITQVLFNDEETPALLGAIALENAFLGVDPLAQRLIPIHGLMMSLRLSR